MQSRFLIAIVILGSLASAPGCKRRNPSFAPDGFVRKDSEPSDLLGPCKTVVATPSCSDGFCAISSGCFTMGSPPSEGCRYATETQHEVRLTHRLEMSATEVTQEQYTKLMGQNPSYHVNCGKSCPVEFVTWHQAAAYCNALSDGKSLARCYECQGTGKDMNCELTPIYATGGKSLAACPGYRLPTEAEWEFAYRAGRDTPLYNGDHDPKACFACRSLDPMADAIGWYCGNAQTGPKPVGQKAPNGWGLYDMAGNVWEWVHDWSVQDLGAASVIDPQGPATGTKRVMRGGSYANESLHMRAAHRHSTDPASRAVNTGFRCVRSL